MSKKQKNSLVFRIEKTGIAHVSYIFGTMHTNHDAAFKFEPLMREKIASCDLFGAELNLDTPPDHYESLFQLKDDLSIQSLMRPKHYEKATKIFLQTTGLPLDNFKKIMPSFLLGIVTQHLMPEGKNGHLGLDEHLWQVATELQKARVGLETYQEQISVITNIPLRNQTKTLLDALGNIKRFRKNLKQTLELFEQADIDKLYKKGKRELKGLRATMLYNRNERMAERISTFASESTCCFAIGAGHLAGKRGVLQRLADDGFQVSRCY